MGTVRTNAWHKVAQGESIESIAFEARMLPDTIWNDPKNRSLKDRRKDPNILMPGDVVFVPAVDLKAQQASTGGKAKYEVKKPTTRLKLRFLEGDAACANVSYVLVVDGGQEIRGSTDGDGRIDVPIPVDAKEAALELGAKDDVRKYALRLRQLDPLTEVSGVQARLAALGYDVGAIDGESGPWTEAAIAAFQAHEGLQATGKVDDAVRRKLEERYGC